MKCAPVRAHRHGQRRTLAARYGQDYLYTTAKGWLGWDGRRYRVLNQEKDSTPAEVMASVFATVRAIQDEAHFVRDTGWPDWEILTEKQQQALEEAEKTTRGSRSAWTN
jgi:hypothetical protein